MNQPTVHNGGVSRGKVCGCGSAEQDQIEVESTYKKQNIYSTGPTTKTKDGIAMPIIFHMPPRLAMYLL